MSEERGLNWTIVSKDPMVGQVASSERPLFNLVNETVDKALCYKEREYGINLEFLEASANNVTFRKASGDFGPILFDEPIAISIAKGGYLKYQSREYGINLVWSKTPIFEWRLVGGEPGTPIDCAQPLGVYNDVEKDCLFYQVRDWGVNLKWTADDGKYMKWTRLRRVVGAAQDAYDAIK